MIGVGGVIYVVNPNGSFILLGLTDSDTSNRYLKTDVGLYWPKVKGWYTFTNSEEGGESRYFERHLDNQFG